MKVLLKVPVCPSGGKTLKCSTQKVLLFRKGSKEQLFRKLEIN